MKLNSPGTACPSDLSLNSASGLCSAVGSFGNVQVSDNCPGSSYGLFAGQANESAFPVGDNIVTYQGTDVAGNMQTCQFHVVVQDVEVPVIQCPASISMNSTTGVCGASVGYSLPTGGDNCPNSDITRLTGKARNRVFPVGFTNVSFKITDSSSLISYCSFGVRITDVEKPALGMVSVLLSV